ncbi:PREDICTED: LINE-1 type transposase domain-containing protein 1 [Xyrichtys novacula]|uniref:PREDICTED: LINE-1 type transposase domain-containing protein 1 n=2 Tax=Xyrichtys novacula TaxID=13765 RepID=A0AAV1EQE2_XYRNO|nr:PREDICTED: LINE-1 type transposase domain-containing protein 1 [Xyrichtys novacula]
MSNNSKANFFKGAATRSKLASKTSPTRERTSASPTAAYDSDRTPGEYDEKTVLEEIRNMSATLQMVATDVVSIKETTKELKDAVQSIQVRLGEAEQRISDVEDVNTRMEKSMEKCGKRLETLWTRVEDLENRSRRNNVRVVGLKEGKEETGKVIQYVEKIISQGLGLSGSEFEIERAHRSLAPIPDPDQPPRTILMRFLRSSARDKVLQVAKERRGIDWEDCKLSFFEDVSRELAEKRKAFTPVKRRLHALNVRHRLVYPATLIFTWKGQKKTFRDSNEAEEFVQGAE